MKIYSSIVFFLFSYFAYLQLNDPDPALWFTLYISVAILGLIHFFQNLPSSIIWIFFGFYSGMAFAWSFQIKFWNFAEEVFNETFGLIIASLFIIGFQIVYRLTRKNG
jgi:hypothetical protein